jgi:hypothetical protein
MYGQSAVCIESTKEDDPLDRVRTCHELGRLPAMEGVALRRAGLRVSSPRVWARKDAWRGASYVTELDGIGVSGVMA